uniref:Uncharacterized protein n=1 Tax=Romanomermis culicivorax TaxID=13658 RepID=A0A915HV68_ROMCU
MKICFEISQLRKDVTPQPNIHSIQKTMLYLYSGKGPVLHREVLRGGLVLFILTSGATPCRPVPPE